MASPGDDSWEYSLRKYLLLLATLVATVTYGAGFNPPGGVWQAADRSRHRIAGDPIIRDTDYPRYLAFFYSNATAFASSLVVIVLILLLSILHDRDGAAATSAKQSPVPVRVLRGVMVLDLVSVMMAYAAGTFRDVLTAVYSLLLLAGVIAYLVFLASSRPQEEDVRRRMRAAQLRKAERRPKVLMLLATFAVSVTYLAGLSAPGGFWDHEEDGHRPGDAVLKGGPHDARLKAFFVSNTTAFVASLLILVMLLGKKLRFRQEVTNESYVFIAVTLAGLMAAYAAGSSRKIDTTIYVSALVGAVVLCILLQVVLLFLLQVGNASGRCSFFRVLLSKLSICYEQPPQHNTQDQQTSNAANGNVSVSDDQQEEHNRALEKARSLVLLLATLAATITYQAGLNPPGGLWQSDGAGAGGYKAGDPVLLTTNPRRYKAFYYCNSVAFVASLVAIVMVRMRTLHHHNALEAAMVLDLFGLIGSYAAGSCRDVTTSIYAMALAGVVLVYVVIHVVFFTLDDHHSKDGSRTTEEEEKKAEELVEKRRKRLLLFAILAATITYQAGLTPPGGFLGDDDAATGRRAGDPVLLNNYHRRYTAFFYCNSVSFMLSIALVILLVNPNLYRPAIRSNALSVCTAAGMMGIVGGYAAGCTQHIRTSIYIFALAAVVLCSVVLLVVVFFVIHLGKQDANNSSSSNTAAAAADGSPAKDAGGGGVENGIGGDGSSAPAPVGPEAGVEARDEKKMHAKRKYLMLLGILVASVTYQAGLAPPGGAWSSNDGAHAAGDPVMHDNRRGRYLVFFYSNSVSFVASVVVIVLLLPPSLHREPRWLRLMEATIVLDLLGLLVAYAAGSSRTWRTSVYVSALVVAVLAYFAVHVALSCFSRSRRRSALAASPPPPPQNELAVQQSSV